MSEPQASPRLRAAVVVAAAVLLLAGLGSIDAAAPDEPRYLQVAEELRSMEHGPGGLVVLHLNGEVYTQKPPLYYWVAAAMGAPAGRVSEWTARLPSAVSGIALIWLVMHLGSRLFGSTTGVLGAALLLSVYEFGHLARRAQLDPMLALFEATALAAFWWTDRGLGPRTRGVLLMHGAMGLAVMTKGPVGFLVPVLVMVAFLGWEKRLGDLRRLFPAWALLLSLGPGLAWVVAASALAPAGFVDDAVGTGIFGRFFSGTSHARPFYYFLYKFPQDFLPWTLLWPAVFWVGRRRVFASPPAGAGEETQRAWRFLLAWVGASLLFFSISSGKRGLYMLPAFPAAAMLCADSCTRWLSGRAVAPRALTALACGFGLLLAALGVEALLAGAGRQVFLPEEMTLGLHRPLMLAFGCAVIGILSAGAVAWIVLRRNRAPVLSFVGAAVVTVLAIEAALFALLYPALDPIRSPRPIAAAAASLTEADEPIGLVSDRAMLGGIAYYADRPVTQLSTPESVRRFLDEGGRAIVVKRRKLDRVTSIAPVEIVASARGGRREVVVVRPRRGASGTQDPALPEGSR